MSHQALDLLSGEEQILNLGGYFYLDASFLQLIREEVHQILRFSRLRQEAVINAYRF